MMDETERALLALAEAAAAGAAPPALPPALAEARLFHLTFRQDGKRLASQWHDGVSLADGLEAGLRAAPGATTIELSLAGSRKKINPDDFGRAASSAWRGLYGVELRTGAAKHRLAPLEMLTRNLGPTRAVEKLAEAAGIPADDATGLWQFRAEEVLIDLAGRRATRLFRGQEIVPQGAISRDSVADMAAQMTAWLVRQVGKDGKTTYKYWPSRGEYSDANNMIRQFMGSACLALAAERDAGVADATRRNFAYNFKTFYHDRADHGVIDEDGKIKLGAAGVALQAILNLIDPAPYMRQGERLRAFIEAMQQADGSFRTFLEPAWRTDGENFYPGEAMLALAMLNDRSPDMALTDRLWRGFRHYRDWHLENRNPAFVPWHTQALCLFHKSTGAAELAEFVFAMNDWLLGLQQGPEAPPDVQGEFFDPHRPHFGPPHASATGVYMEGLIEAWSLARQLGDRRRADSYHKALVRAARSLRQLQYRDDLSMFYLHRKARAAGGIRTSVFNNEIRIDNVQHGLMALWKMLDRFTPADFEI